MSRDPDGGGKRAALWAANVIQSGLLQAVVIVVFLVTPGGSVKSNCDLKFGCYVTRGRLEAEDATKYLLETPTRLHDWEVMKGCRVPAARRRLRAGTKLRFVPMPDTGPPYIATLAEFSRLNGVTRSMAPALTRHGPIPSDYYWLRTMPVRQVMRQQHRLQRPPVLWGPSQPPQLEAPPAARRRPRLPLLVRPFLAGLLRLRTGWTVPEGTPRRGRGHLQHMQQRRELTSGKAAVLTPAS